MSNVTVPLKPWFLAQALSSCCGTLANKTAVEHHMLLKGVKHLPTNFSKSSCVFSLPAHYTGVSHSCPQPLTERRLPCTVVTPRTWANNIARRCAMIHLLLFTSIVVRTLDGSIVFLGFLIHENKLKLYRNFRFCTKFVNEISAIIGLEIFLET